MLQLCGRRVNKRPSAKHPPPQAIRTRRVRSEPPPRKSAKKRKARRPPTTTSTALGLLVSLPETVGQTSFTSKSELQAALAEWCADPTAATATHGDISTWDTGGVTDMSGQGSSQPYTSFFPSACHSSCSTAYCITTFNGAIGSWNVVGVTSMDSMFYVRRALSP